MAPGSVGSLVRSRKLAGIALAAGLAIGGLTASTAAAATSSCGGSGAVSTLNATLQDGATYTIQCPAGAWNGTLYLYSHGYVVPGARNPAADVGDPVTGAWMLAHGYALAKNQLFRTLDDVNSVPELGKLEAEVMEQANRIGLHLRRRQRRAHDQTLEDR